MDEDTTNLLCGTPVLPPHCVALTFDDGPGPQSAELSLMLGDEGVPATFFVLGESVERYGQALDTHRDCGHVIALHGEFHHPFASVELAADQLRRCRQRLAGYLRGTIWFRPPYGIGDEPVAGYAGPVGWHAHGRDWDITYRRVRPWPTVWTASSRPWCDRTAASRCCTTMPRIPNSPRTA